MSRLKKAYDIAVGFMRNLVATEIPDQDVIETNEMVLRGGSYKTLLEITMKDGVYHHAVFSRAEEDIIDKVHAHAGGLNAERISITDVLCQDTPSGLYEKAELSSNTRQAIDAYNQGDKPKQHCWLDTFLPGL